MAASGPPLRPLILVPALITLAVTLLRLIGELSRWSPRFFNRDAGGPGALVGIVWLVPVFGVYFALRLARAGDGPAHAGKALGFSLLAFVLNSALSFGSFALFPTSPVAQLAIFTLASGAAIALARPGWPSLWRILLGYGLAARIPVLVIMFLAIFGSWDTHYAKPRPDFPAMGPWGLFFWTALLPQMAIWIYVTVVGGLIFGSLAVGIRRLMGGRSGAAVPTPSGTLKLLLAAAILGAPSLAAAQPFTVGTARAERGQTATGTIDVPAGSDAATSIPVIVVHGARPGPVLAIVSGAHGTEYASIVAVEKLIGRLDPAQVSGTVILVPLVNRASFDQKVVHVNPVDGKSMNRFYPGRADGTQTERASFLITREVVDRCDHLIDLHGGDLDESLRPYTYWTVTGREEQDRVSREMVLAFGLDHVIISADRPKDPAASRYLENTASTRGKASITAEAGHAGTVEPDDVEALVRGCLGVMRYLKMLPGAAEMVASPVWIENVLTVTSDEPGLFYPQVSRGAYVAKGTALGYVTDFYGRKVFEARAPGAGVVLYICSVPTMTKGGTVASVGVVKAGS
jgi:hypothetical protein